MTNETLISGDVPVVIDQGPVWLAKLLYAPPGWVWPATIGLFAVAIGWAGLGYYRSGIDRGVLEEMAANLSVVLGIAGTTTLFSALEHGGYLFDVTFGVIVGYALAVAFQAFILEPILEAS